MAKELGTKEDVQKRVETLRSRHESDIAHHPAYDRDLRFEDWVTGKVLYSQVELNELTSGDETTALHLIRVIGAYLREFNVAPLAPAIVIGHGSDRLDASIILTVLKA